MYMTIVTKSVSKRELFLALGDGFQSMSHINNNITFEAICEVDALFFFVQNCVVGPECSGS